MLVLDQKHSLVEDVHFLGVNELVLLVALENLPFDDLVFGDIEVGLVRADQEVFFAAEALVY